MKSVATCLAVAAGLASASVTKRSVPEVTVKGNAFYAGNDRFYIRGVDYQPGKPILAYSYTLRRP